MIMKVYMLRKIMSIGVVITRLVGFVQINFRLILIKIKYILVVTLTKIFTYTGCGNITSFF